MSTPKQGFAMSKKVQNRDESITNMHKDHVASCLCCGNLYATLGEPGYSDLTPGSPGYVSCGKGVFTFDEGDGFRFLETIHDEAKHCKFFEPKD